MSYMRNMMSGLVAVAMTAIPLHAGSSSETLLTVSVEGAEPVTYDREMLEEMGTVTFSTTTIWTEGEQTFTGVPLNTLLESLDVEDGTLFASAINDYTIEFPVEDGMQDGPIIAHLLNGEPMSVRDKGPLWIVYPYDENPDFRTEVVYARSIWQLDRIEIKE